MLKFLEKLFSSTISGKLKRLKEYCEKSNPKYSVGKEIILHANIGANETHYYSALVSTNCSHLGDVNGVYQFFTSPKFSNSEYLLNHMTQQVAEAANDFPDYIFIKHQDGTFKFSHGEWIETNQSKREN
jgi:hypothetical protein